MPRPTLTANRQLDWFPASSVAVHVTIVLPSGKRLPEGGAQTISGDGSLQSLAVTEKVTTSPGGVPKRSNTSRVEGQEIVGGVVSAGKPHLARPESPESKHTNW